MNRLKPFSDRVQHDLTVFAFARARQEVASLAAAAKKYNDPLIAQLAIDARVRALRIAHSAARERGISLPPPEDAVTIQRGAETTRIKAKRIWWFVDQELIRVWGSPKHYRVSVEEVRHQHGFHPMRVMGKDGFWMWEDPE